MNRSFISVILGGFGAEDAAVSKDVEQRPVKKVALMMLHLL